LKAILCLILAFCCSCRVFAAAEVCTEKAASKSWTPAELSGFVGKKGFGYQNLQLMDEDGQAYLRVRFPRGSIDPGGVARIGAPLGGAGARLPTSPVVGDCIWAGYRIRFPVDFAFVKGGKLPGLAGGAANTGGKIPNGRDGFSARYMWRSMGMGEVYAYLPDSVEWGTSLGRGAWRFLRGPWNRIEQVVRLNTPGRKDGYLAVWLNGTLVFEQGGLRFRDVPELRVDTFLLETFFGGNAGDWASDHDTFIDFKDFSVATARNSLVGR